MIRRRPGQARALDYLAYGRLAKTITPLRLEMGKAYVPPE